MTTDSEHIFVVARLREMLGEYETEAGSADFHMMLIREYRRASDGKGFTLKLGVSPVTSGEGDC